MHTIKFYLGRDPCCKQDVFFFLCLWKLKRTYVMYVDDVGSNKLRCRFHCLWFNTGIAFFTSSFKGIIQYFEHVWQQNLVSHFGFCRNETVQMLLMWHVSVFLSWRRLPPWLWTCVVTTRNQATVLWAMWRCTPTGKSTHAAHSCSVSDPTVYIRCFSTEGSRIINFPGTNVPKFPRSKNSSSTLWFVFPQQSLGRIS